MDQRVLSVIIPAYNEERYIRQTVLEVAALLQNEKRDFEIIVVNDGSSDQTLDIVHALQKKTANLFVLSGKSNKGKGWAVRSGMLKARGDLSLIMDADNSAEIREYHALLDSLERGADVAIGSRALKESDVKLPQSFLRRLLGKVGNVLIRLILLPDIKDSQCGFKLFRGNAAKEIFSKAMVDNFAFDVEALVLAKTLGYKIEEVGISWKHESDSKVTVGAYLQTFWDVLKIFWRFKVRPYLKF